MRRKWSDGPENKRRWRSASPWYFGAGSQIHGVLGRGLSEYLVRKTSRREVRGVCHGASGAYNGYEDYVATQGSRVGLARQQRVSSAAAVLVPHHDRSEFSLFLGAIWIRPDHMKWKWRVVVGQQATLKADQIYLLAEDNLALAA